MLSATIVPLTNFPRYNIMIQGSIVAIVTPMHADGSLDLLGLKKLIDWHIAEGTDGIVIVGTTGDADALDEAATSQRHGRLQLQAYGWQHLDQGSSRPCR